VSGWVGSVQLLRCGCEVAALGHSDLAVASGVYGGVVGMEGTFRDEWRAAFQDGADAARTCPCQYTIDPFSLITVNYELIHLSGAGRGVSIRHLVDPASQCLQCPQWPRRLRSSGASYCTAERRGRQCRGGRDRYRS